tara:strand:- start:443 stop:655 length:213 start_codon:yes stop_codon:yes gene_type:complete
MTQVHFSFGSTTKTVELSDLKGPEDIALNMKAAMKAEKAKTGKEATKKDIVKAYEKLDESIDLISQNEVK